MHTYQTAVGSLAGRVYNAGMRSLLVPLLIIVACNRGPEPKPFVAEPTAVAAPVAAVSPPTPAVPAAPRLSTPNAGALTWDAPPPFEAQPRSSPMRAAEYALPAVNGEVPTLTVFFFGPGQGGSVEDNLKRWISQFTQVGGRDSSKVAKRGTLQVNGMNVTTVDLTGTFAGSSPGMSPTQPPPGPKANQRLLGAIVEGPQGPVFFKFTGPAAALESARKAFDQLIKSIRPLS
jgi:hypothetical protein